MRERSESDCVVRERSESDCVLRERSESDCVVRGGVRVTVCCEGEECDCVL